MSPFSFRCISSYLSPILLCLLVVATYASSPSGEDFVSVVITPSFRCRAFPTGGDDGIRTHDPLLAGQVLSQLSYTPLGVCECPLESLKIEQQQTRTSSKFSLAPLSHIFFSFSFVYLRYSILRLSLDATFSIERR